MAVYCYRASTETRIGRTVEVPPLTSADAAGVTQFKPRMNALIPISTPNGRTEDCVTGQCDLWYLSGCPGSDVRAS